MLVVDASVLIPALVSANRDGTAARERLRDEDLIAPELIDLEVVSALRGLVASRQVRAATAGQALDDLATIPMRRASHRTLVDRCWELRHRASAYDAAYIAVAEAIDAPLLTADQRLGRVRGARCEIQVLT